MVFFWGFCLKIVLLIIEVKENIRLEVFLDICELYYILKQLDLDLQMEGVKQLNHTEHNQQPKCQSKKNDLCIDFI